MRFFLRLDLGRISTSVSQVTWDFHQCLVNHFSPNQPWIFPSPRLETHLNQHLTSYLGFPPSFHNLFLTSSAWDSPPT
ncbi:hypothetical protein E5676_scaffold225G00640 [Cucumis melo var. makuwa]|uniref:Uncharacterized protein n=1 Tax=Cucumis melo var. makuwa TaxID=1194695 RepID=A0A5D3DWV2_CUCMM|nr:hypothetical protein E5676_scaffold225G00640 [Cucumis melo var. makuwa]